MKKIILSLAISICSLLIMTLICSVIVSYLQYNKSIQINPYIIQVISIIFFLLSGMIFGFINKKQGLIGSMLFILVYLIFVLIFDVFNKTATLHKLYFLFIIGKCISYSAGSIIGVNLRH